MSDYFSIHVSGSEWLPLCKRIIAQAKGFQGDLAFIYIADELAGETDRIIDTLRTSLGIAHWIGCVGMGLCSNGRETYDEAAIAVLLTPLRNDQLRLIPNLKEDLSAWLDKTRQWREDTLASVAVVHADPSNTTLPGQLLELSEGMRGGFLVGGIASGDKLALQIADGAVGGGLSGVILAGSVAISTGLSQGCSLIGEKHSITRCERNIIELIDDRPALDVFKEDIGEVLARDLRRVGGYIFAALPIPGSDTGDYLVRNLIGIDPDHGLLAIGDLVENGMEIQFAKRDADTAREDLEQMIERLKRRLPDAPRGALYHSCLGRGRNLFGDNSAEMRLINELLGDVPLAGFYANGEISHNRLYGYTGVLTLFC